MSDCHVEFRINRPFHGGDQLFLILVEDGTPLVGRLQVDEIFGVAETAGIGSVVRPAYFGFSVGATMKGARHRRDVPDHSQRYIRLGLLILLSPLWVPMLLVLFVGVFGPPPAKPVAQQDQPHRYERHDIVVFDSKGGRHTVPTWKRVDD